MVNKDSEKYIERKLKKRIEDAGGLCIKLSSPVMRALPDRMILFYGKCFFVEVKSKGKKPTALQKIRHAELHEQGFKVFVIDSMEGVDNVLKEIKI